MRTCTFSIWTNLYFRFYDLIQERRDLFITEWCEECHASHHSLWGIEVHYMEGARHIIRIEVKHDPGRYLGVLDKRFNFTPKTVLHLEGMETLL